MATSNTYEIANVSDLKDGEKKEVDVPGTEQKVLLCRIDDKFFATSPKCTHYGAPLANGVLTKEGRITCPWHGACFKLDTGDIEDAPAIDPIIAFKTQTKGDKVVIEATEEDLKAGRRKPSCAVKKTKTDDSVVIVGGGASATTTAEALREYGFAGKITVLSAEDYYPIDRTKLSKALIADASKIALRDEAFYKELDIDFRKSSEVKSIDKKEKKVVLSSGESVSYGKLVLAVGGTAKRLPMDGFDLDNVYVLRNLTHAQQIVSARDANDGQKKKIVIVGSSFIGMEAAFATAKDHDVTVIGMESTPLKNVLGEQIGQTIQKSAEKQGVKFYLDAGVEKAIASEKDPKKAGKVLLKDGTELECDLVILGVGIAPATKFLDGQLTLEKDGGLQTDEYLQVKGEQDIFAVGDIAHFPYTGPGAEGKPIRIEHWDVAQNHGRAVAKTLSGTKKPFQNVPYFWSAQGAQLRYCGNNSPTVGWDDLVIQGSLDEGKFAGFYTKGDQVVAVVSMGYDPVVSKAAELMRRSAMPGKKDLQGGQDIRQLAF
ncbi:Apoptosis-inducing factor 1 [Savitreella phatthalungensis]